MRAVAPSVGGGSVSARAQREEVWLGPMYNAE